MMKTPTFLKPFQQAVEDSIKYENSYVQIPVSYTHLDVYKRQAYTITDQYLSIEFPV